MKRIPMNDRFDLRGPRKMNSLFIEDAILTLLTYASFIAWHLSSISYITFQLLMIVLVFRVFNIRHEKAHLPQAFPSKSKAWLTSYCWVFHSPYQEPYADKRRKHLAHHKGYLSPRPLSTKENPHSLLEQDSFFQSFLTAVFYEEIMFYQDWKFHGGLSKARREMFFASSAALILLWMMFGWVSLLCLIASYRVCMALAWFSFSKLLHIEPFHSQPAIEQLPRPLIIGVELLLGSGAATALLAHEFHHRTPLKFHNVFTEPDQYPELAPLSGI
jgi:hypothetical protein